MDFSRLVCEDCGWTTVERGVDEFDKSYIDRTGVVYVCDECYSIWITNLRDAGIPVQVQENQKIDELTDISRSKPKKRIEL